MKKRKSSRAKARNAEREFQAEAEYADSIVRSAIGDSKGCIAALRRSLEWNPTYAPAILSMGSVEYQLGRTGEGWGLFESLLSLPDDTPDLSEIIDEAGEFLIQIDAYKDGLALYRAAVERFPAVAALHQGVGCCAGEEDSQDEALAASRRALQLEPDNQKLVNDLGWSLFQADDLEEAESMLARAVNMDPSDELARENLRFCKAESSKRRKRINAPKRGGRRTK